MACDCKCAEVKSGLGEIRDKRGQILVEKVSGTEKVNFGERSLRLSRVEIFDELEQEESAWEGALFQLDDQRFYASFEDLRSILAIFQRLGARPPDPLFRSASLVVTFNGAEDVSLTMRRCGWGWQAELQLGKERLVLDSLESSQQSLPFLSEAISNIVPDQGGS